MKRFRWLVPPIVSGLLYGLCFPPYRASLLAWVALAPLLWSLTKGDSAATPFRSGFLALFVANLLIFAWLWPTFRAAQVNALTTFVCWTALSAVMALYGGAFAKIYTSVPWPEARPWIGAAAWVALDEVRTVALTGFPWGLASHTQAHFPAVVQIASVTGAAGVTFLIVLANGAVSEAVRSAGRPRILRSCAVATMVILAAMVAGQWRLSNARVERSDRALTVTVLQGNIDQYQKWDDAYEAHIRVTYGRLLLDAQDKFTELVVWPETAVPGWIPRDPFYVEWISGLVKSSGADHIFGCLSGTEQTGYNAAIFATANGALIGQYNKRHLVPFGEYVPFGGFLKGVVPYLGQVGTFAAGRETVHFPVGDFLVAPNICYEAMFPSLVRHEARGADLIVNITNDAWFLNSGAPEQHFVGNIYRAVENGLPVVRAANTGISAFIDAYGRVMLQSGLSSVGAYTCRMPIPEKGFRTIFARWGNWFGLLCFALTTAWTAFAVKIFCYTARQQNVTRTSHSN